MNGAGSRIAVALMLALLLLSIPLAHADYIYNGAFAGYFQHNHEIARKKGLATLVELARYCQEAGLLKQARMLWLEILTVKKDFAEAHKALGRVKVGKEWMTPEARDKALRAENKDMVRWGDAFVAANTLPELRKALNESTKIAGNTWWHKCEGFEIVTLSSEEAAWAECRAVESALTAFDTMFAALGKGKGSLKLYLFPDEMTLSQHFKDRTGLLPPTGCFYDEPTGAVHGVVGTTAKVVEAATIARLTQLGFDRLEANYWAWSGILSYMKTAVEDDKRVSPGHAGPGATTMKVSARKEDLAFNEPELTRLMKLKYKEFEEEDGFSNMSKAWGVFYVCCHEYQGAFRKEFLKVLKGALEGKAGYPELKKITHWNLILCQLGTLISAIPIEE